MICDRYRGLSEEEENLKKENTQEIDLTICQKKINKN